MKLKKILLDCALLFVSVGVSLLLCEFAARLVFNPADFLSVGMVRDPVYGAVPSTTARTGFDSLGFRNRSVPQTADIIAIGDSQTYGNAATMEDSWPYALGRLANRQVYNMGLGGYGPNQYLQILRTKALNLKPRTILCGLSLTDDFDNAFHLTYGLDYWASYRSLPNVKVDFDTWDTGMDMSPSLQKRVRGWFAQHSVVYQLVVHTGFGDRLKGEYQIKNAAELFPGAATSLVVPEEHILEAFQPVANLHGVDQSRQSVREGMRITFELLKEMDEICRKNNIQFIVVVIPTKEMVFEKYLEHNSKLLLSNVLDAVISNERVAMQQTFEFLANSNIAYVNPLPDMQKAAGQGLFAKSAGDMHPNKNGYFVIAQSVAGYLKQADPGKQRTAAGRQ